MADDSLEIIDPLDFHPGDSPRGMVYYDLDVLTKEQQERLNSLKREVIRDDEQYLADNPEVRAVIALILRYVLKFRPRRGLHRFVAHLFRRPKADLMDEIGAYMKVREPHVYEGNSAVIDVIPGSDSTIATGQIPYVTLPEPCEKSPTQIATDILNEIVSNVLLQIQLAEERAIRSDENFIRNIIQQEIFNKLGENALRDVKDIIEHAILQNVFSRDSVLPFRTSSELVTITASPFDTAAQPIEEAQQQTAPEEHQQQAAAEEPQQQAAPEEAQQQTAPEENQPEAAPQETQQQVVSEEAQQQVAPEAAQQQAASEEPPQQTEEAQQQGASEQAPQPAVEEGKEAPTEEAVKESASEAVKESAAEQVTEAAKDSTVEPVKDSSGEPVNEVPKEENKETAVEAAKDSVEEPAKESVAEPAKSAE